MGRKTDPMSGIGERLQQVQTATKLSVAKIVRRTGIPRATYVGWLNGSATDVASLKAFVKALGVWHAERLLWWLADGSGDKPAWLELGTDPFTQPDGDPPRPGLTVLSGLPDLEPSRPIIKLAASLANEVALADYQESAPEKKLPEKAAELVRTVLQLRGVVGIIVATGLATAAAEPSQVLVIRNDEVVGSSPTAGFEIVLVVIATARATDSEESPASPSTRSRAA